MDRILDIFSFECFLELFNNLLVSKNVLNVGSIFFRKFLSVIVFFRLGDGVERDAEVSQEAI